MRYACNAEGEPGQRRSHIGCKEIGTGDRLPKPFGSHIITPCTLDARNEARRFDFFSMLGFYHSRVKFFPFFFLVYFICSVIKYPGKSNVREERFILARSSRMQSIMEGKSRQREVKAAGCITFTIKN